jgi:hypothetical protein
MIGLTKNGGAYELTYPVSSVIISLSKAVITALMLAGFRPRLRIVIYGKTGGYSNVKDHEKGEPP